MGNKERLKKTEPRSVTGNIPDGERFSVENSIVSTGFMDMIESVAQMGQQAINQRDAFVGSVTRNSETGTPFVTFHRDKPEIIRRELGR